MVNIRSPVSSCGALAMEILDPDNRRISVILLPLRPMIHPTISDGMEMFCVRKLAVDCATVGEWGEGGGERRATSPLDLRAPAEKPLADRLVPEVASPTPGWNGTVP